MEQVNELLELIQALKLMGVTGASVMYSFFWAPDSASTKEVSIWFRLSWTWRSLPDVCRRTTIRRGTEAGGTSTDGYTLCAICPNTLQCPEPTKTVMLSIHPSTFVDHVECI
jgi:hypothetical protein